MNAFTEHIILYLLLVALGTVSTFMIIEIT